MLKKSSNFLPEKLCALTLLEVDFKALHKINFNDRLIPFLEDLSKIPQEIIGEKISQADTHLALSKKLFQKYQTLRNYLLLRHALKLLTNILICILSFSLSTLECN